MLTWTQGKSEPKLLVHAVVRVMIGKVKSNYLEHFGAHVGRGAGAHGTTASKGHHCLCRERLIDSQRSTEVDQLVHVLFQTESYSLVCIKCPLRAVGIHSGIPASLAALELLVIL